MISALARANRSYCEGHSHNDMEVRMSITLIELLEPEVLSRIELCGDNSDYKIDPFVLDVSGYMVDQGCYANVHPLTKNIF